jgi:Mg-chelatase subunit ChlD
MNFGAPLTLLLLLLLPVFAWLGWPSRGPSQKRETLALLLRLTIVLCLVLSLAGLEISRGGNELAVVFLVDVSDSMPPAAVAAEMDYVRGALKAMGPDDQSALVLFGGDALVERPMQTGSELGLVTSVPVTNQTNLAEALRLGMALLPARAARRMVVLSDGAQTSGDALKAAEFAAASGVQIIAVPFITQGGAEALVTAVEAPSNLRPGEKFNLNVSIQASQPLRATLRVLAGDKILYEQPHDLRRGQQTFSLPLSAGEPGFTSYQVQIEPQQDGFYQNNRLDAFSQVDGPPRILMVAPATGESLPGGGTRSDEHSALLQALQAAGFDVSVVPPSGLPSDLPLLAQYNSLVLVDVPARELGSHQMEAVQSYVRDLGGGLVVIGGPTSYGVGGYYGTPLEAALPVYMQIKDEKRRPSLAIVFIIDHSGSMSEQSGGVVKLELAKEAAARSIELLFPTDRVGVIAFDDAASWVVPMTDLSNPGAVRQAIGSIRIGGGTDILAGVQAMAKVLPGDVAKVKHVILLTDGGADPAGIPELVKKLNTENGITFSTVGVGQDAAPFLADLARVGGGRYHFTTDAGSIPSIFTEETTLAMRSYIEEHAFFPTLVNSSPILAGIKSLPQLQGYVATSPKELAQVILKTDKDDPLLATWQYGLGRAVAFTSDATGRWGRAWVSWDSYATFWAQAVRYSLNQSTSTALQMNVDLQNAQAHVTLDARSLGGNFLNDYQINANVVAPDGEVQAVTLNQVAPGRYETSFTPRTQGVYLFHFSGKSAEGQGAFSETSGWTLSYSPEYRNTDPNPDLLVRLAAMTGGKVASSNPAEAFAHNLPASRATRPIWPWLMALAALLLPFDIAARRLILTRHDFIRMREVLAARLGPRKRTARAARSSPGMQALFKAKERARENTPVGADGVRPDVRPDNPANIPAAQMPSVTEQEPAIKDQAGSRATPAAPPSEPHPETSTTAALLARKKNLGGKRK